MGPLTAGTLAPYPTLDAVLAEARTYGEAECVGRSVEGREILAVRVPGDGPVVCVTAGLHGLEWIGTEVALEVLRAGPLPGADLWVLPVLNPDGRERTARQDGAGRVRDLRRNARGVDLNRNFPLPYGARPTRVPFAGGSHPDSPTFRGTAPLSEPESAAVAAFLGRIDAHASANLHSFMGALIAARVWHRDDWSGYTALCRAFRAAQDARVGYVRLASPWLDVFTGELEDWQHHALRCWSVCVEHFALPESVRQHVRAPSGFWRFNPRDPRPIVARDAPAVRAMLTASLALPRPPARDGASASLPAWGASRRGGPA